MQYGVRSLVYYKLDFLHNVRSTTRSPRRRLRVRGRHASDGQSNQYPQSQIDVGFCILYNSAHPISFVQFHAYVAAVSWRGCSHNKCGVGRISVLFYTEWSISNARTVDF